MARKSIEQAQKALKDLLEEQKGDASLLQKVKDHSIKVAENLLLNKQETMANIQNEASIRIDETEKLFDQLIEQEMERQSLLQDKLDEYDDLGMRGHNSSKAKSKPYDPENEFVEKVMPKKKEHKNYVPNPEDPIDDPIDDPLIVQ